jgi:uncharacterized protein (TIGR02246 family)
MHVPQDPLKNSTWASRARIPALVAVLLALPGGAAVAAEGTTTALEQSALRESEATVKAFNAADATALGSMFLESGEFIDESGIVHAGRPAITALFTRFFEQYPQAGLELAITSVRPVGDALAVEEGRRRITTAGGDAAEVRYAAVRTKQGERWPIASYRELSDDPLPTPREALQSLAWIEGDWVDEGPQGRTAISFRWSDDGNFLIGDYTMSAAGGSASKSTQRIGWDAVTGHVRSWTFDDDGGFTQGRWNATDDGWVVTSEATLPDGTTGSATLVITAKGDDRFVVRGSNRIVGGEREPDFELTIARKPPQPGASK